jgi:hypothetical protein
MLANHKLKTLSNSQKYCKHFIFTKKEKLKIGLKNNSKVGYIYIFFSRFGLSKRWLA